VKLSSPDVAPAPVLRRCADCRTDGREISARKALELVARRFAVLSEPARLRLIHALLTEKRTRSSRDRRHAANTSRHLQTHRRTFSASQGLQVFYSIADPSIFKLCSSLRQLKNAHEAGMS
jgi:ArsR family transcriptional regulator